MELLRKTKQRWQPPLYGVVSGLACVALAMAWLLSTWGQIQLVKRDLINLSRGKDQETLRVIAMGLASVGNPQQAAEMAGRIDYPAVKVRALGAVAQATAQLGDASTGAALLKSSAEVAGQIDHPSAKARVLRSGPGNGAAGTLAASAGLCRPKCDC